MSADIVKIREWEDADEPMPEEGWDWPHPPYCIESRVEGDLRRRVLANVGRTADEPCEVRLIERECEGGWSEYTSETWFEMELWLDEGRQSQRIWSTDYEWSQESGLAALLKWTEDRG